jgi:hypothetical protein
MPKIARTLILLATLTLCAGFAHAAVLSGVEAMSSTVMQPHQSSFSGLGLRARITPPRMMEGFSIVPSLEYWRNHSTIQAFDIQATRKDATLAALVRYDFQHAGWQPYLGGGLGLHFLSNEVDAPSLGLRNATDSTIKGGVVGLAGVTFGLAGKLGNLIEVEYHGLSDQSQFKINWGLSVGF